MRRFPRLFLAVLLALLSFSFSNAPPKPKLVVLISVDQMRADYLERFAYAFAGGFKTLSQNGVFYRDANLNYASSETGPGHATLSTGSYPATSGILGNEWTDPKSRRQVYCVEDPDAKAVEGEGGGYSPRNLVVTAIGDWLKAASPESKVLSVSVKDRAAILMGGQHPDYAFWYDRKTGHMVTSDYYTRRLPAWVKSFNASGWIEKNVPDAWTKLLPDSVYTSHGPDEMEGEMKWDGSTSFPHKFAADKKKDLFLTSPYGDMMVLDFALRAIQAERLGQRNVTDLLCIGLSSTDYVGHSFGSDSHEILDHLLRLDLALGKFLTTIEEIVGRKNILIALSADHAVLPLPEYLTLLKHQSARRIIFNRDLLPKIQEFDKLLRNELGVSKSLIETNGFLNYTAAAEAHVDSLTLEHRVRLGLTQIDGIADVYFRREMMNKQTSSRPYLGQFQRSYYPTRGEDFQIRFCENCLITSRPTGTSHGSVYRYDTHVPIVFSAEGVQSARVSRPVQTVDIAPTVARLLEIPYPKTVDGNPLIEIVK